MTDASTGGSSSSLKGDALNMKSQSFIGNPHPGNVRPGLSAVDSSISTMSMPVNLRMHSDGDHKVTNASLFGALKFKGLLNLRLRARRAKLGQQQGECGTGFPRLRGFSLLTPPEGNTPPAVTPPTGSSDYGTMHTDDGRSVEDGLNPSCEKTNATDWMAIKAYTFGNTVSIFLLCIPFGVLAKVFDWGNSAVFLFNFFAILPLAQLLGDFTEEVALYTNDTVGGLLNATLGNATELIISIFAIQKGLLRVVQVSLLGSVLSNELLVTGCCFLFGGYYHKEQHFNSHIASIDSSLLLMAVLGLTIPSAFSATVANDCKVPCRVDSIATISHITAILLFFLYGMLLVFQLKTHTHLMDLTGHEQSHHSVQQHIQFASINGSPAMNARRESFVRSQSRNGKRSKTLSMMSSDPLEDEQDPEEATMTLKAAIMSLSLTTLLVALCSELLVDSIEAVSVSWDLSEVFIGMILLPIIGNAAEHATAITVAIKGKMDLALGVALGSSVQIALCVVPALCLVGWGMDKPLTLDFHPFETIVLVVSVLVVTSTVRQGTSTWLEGIMLIISYFIIAIAYYYRKEPPAAQQIIQPNCVCGEPCCF